MTHDNDCKYKSGLGLSWYDEPERSTRRMRSLSDARLANRLGEVARELHLAYGNAKIRRSHVVLALYLLDILQGEIG